VHAATRRHSCASACAGAIPGDIFFWSIRQGSVMAVAVPLSTLIRGIRRDFVGNSPGSVDFFRRRNHCDSRFSSYEPAG